MPKRDDVFVTIFNVVIHDKGIIHSSDLLLAFVPAAHFEGHSISFTHFPVSTKVVELVETVEPEVPDLEVAELVGTSTGSVPTITFQTYTPEGQSSALIAVTCSVRVWLWVSLPFMSYTSTWAL